MTIFIIFSSQKDTWSGGGKSSAVTRYPHFCDRRVAHGIARCILLRTFIYTLLVYLGAVAQRKKDAKLC